MNAEQLGKLGYAQDPAEGVWLPAGSAPKAFAYSDGDVESYIYDQLGQVSDLSTGSTELVLKMKDWPTLYHFSPQRADLLRPLGHLLQGSVLEIGAGCGALSRFLGETAREVVAVEGSMRRANIARRRCRGQQNVEVLCGNAMDLALPKTFDVVTLVGVLEYSKKFVAGHDPVTAMLRHARSLLAADGVLVLAIENQLGLKYFAGAFEDHEGKPFYGIHGSYAAGEAVTFGRQALLRKLEGAGFAGTRFFYPFPDYKMPQVVLSHEGALSQEKVIANLADAFVAPDQGAAYRRTFSEQAAWPHLIDNGLMPELANSFLVVARERAFCAGDDALAHPGDLAYVYSTCRRARQFHKENVLRRTDGGDGVQAMQRRLYPQMEARRGGLVQRLCDEAAVSGPSLLRELAEIVNRPGWSTAQVAAWAEPWVQMVEEVRAQEGHAQHEMPHLPGHYVDFSPQNVMREHRSGALRAGPMEWDLGQPIPAHYVLFRGLMHALGACHTVAQPAPGTPLHAATIAQQVLQALHWPLTQDECLSLASLESTVFGGTAQGFWQAHVQPRA